ncbi:MAG: P-loop NTPase [Candidatus Schekmanbacteria bacterium]|nr:P-loop NTPase [Candidatus Schekmanbacteria bacterium]
MLSIAVAGGKGGVGKTLVAVHLAEHAARKKIRTCLLDADLGLGNVRILLKLPARGDISDVLSGDKRLWQVMATLPSGLRVLPAPSGVLELATVDNDKLGLLLSEIGRMEHLFDLLVLDLGAGIGPAVLELAAPADHVLAVTTTDRTAIADCYAFIKVHQGRAPATLPWVLVNMADSPASAAGVFAQFTQVCDRFLFMKPRWAGSVPRDPNVTVAIREATLLYDLAGEIPAAKALATASEQLLRSIFQESVGNGRRSYAASMLETAGGGVKRRK